VRFATKWHWLRARRPQQVALTGALGVLVVYFAAQGWRRGGETLWTLRAEYRPAFSPEQAAALQNALACEPKNFETAYNLAECFRTRSLDGGTNYVELAETALNYYALGSRLNPHDAYCPLGAGMCLDWLGRHAEAEKYYAAAEVRDPNGNYIVANIGWHFTQIGDYAAARQWVMRANKLANWHNETAKSYLFDVCEPKLMEKASGRLPMGLFYFNGKDH
jgi:tetratricopeptide (TPR) repeat protein